MSVVHVVRHGEVENPDGILYGRAPGFVLSERGEQMALAAAEYLAGRDIAYVVASPLERAQQTARPIAEKFGLQVASDQRLIESLNNFAGQQFQYGQLLRRAFWLRNPFKPSWGEPYVEVAARMFAGLLAARDAADGREAVLVSHQLPIWTLRRYALGQRLWHDPRRRQCALGSVTSLRFDGDRVAGYEYHVPAPDLVAAAMVDDRAKKKRRRSR